MIDAPIYAYATPIMWISLIWILHKGMHGDSGSVPLKGDTKSHSGIFEIVKDGNQRDENLIQNSDSVPSKHWISAAGRQHQESLRII